MCCFEHKFGFYLLSCLFFVTEIVFFGNIYVNLPVLLVKNMTFSVKFHFYSEFHFLMVIPFSPWRLPCLT